MFGIRVATFTVTENTVYFFPNRLSGVRHDNDGTEKRYNVFGHHSRSQKY